MPKITPKPEDRPKPFEPPNPKKPVRKKTTSIKESPVIEEKCFDGSICEGINCNKLASSICTIPECKSKICPQK